MTDWRLATIDCVSKLDTPYGRYLKRLIESLRSLVEPFSNRSLDKNQDQLSRVVDAIDDVCRQALYVQHILRGSKDLYLCEGDTEEVSVLRRTGSEYERFAVQHATEQGFTSAGPNEKMRYVIFGALKKYAVEGEEEVLQKALVLEKRRNLSDNAVEKPPVNGAAADPDLESDDELLTISQFNICFFGT
jgi:hypothetical protein